MHVDFIVQIPMGRKCVEHYKDVCRQCVFSHDELVWKLAGLIVSGKVHDAELTRYVLQDMLSVLPTERRLRRELEQQVRVPCMYCTRTLDIKQI